MKRLLVVGLVALVLAMMASPALAQRDPFGPGGGGGGGNQEQPEPDGNGNGSAEPAPPSVQPAPPQTLPNTGSEATPWVVAAYVLVTVGAGSVVLARLTRPSYLRR